MKRELFISFTGHLVVFLTVGFFTVKQKSNQITRPAVITVQILKGGAQEPETPKPTPRLIEPAPKPTPSKKDAEKPKPKASKKGDDGIVRHQGLGAKIEGIQALGYNYYLQEMLERIGENWENLYHIGSQQLKATVVFVIERDGRLVEIKLEKGSGNEMFDESCVRAVAVTKKLPPLPNEFTAPRIKIHLEFER